MGKGEGRWCLPAQHGACETEVSHDRSLHAVSIASHHAFGDVAEETLVVV